MSKKRALKMHPRLLVQTIQRQAGTLAKAITEGVMNSIEAGGDYCDVTISEDAVLIEDNGRGFRSMEEIENWFETFGTPHEESEGKIWANFRIGRGQMFSFGRNIWTTKKFVMDVDFKEMAEQSDELCYDLHEADEEESFDGCQVLIELYKKLLPSDLERILKELKQMVRWVAKPVYINGEECSKNPAEAKWDFENPDCYVKLRKNGGLSVYNLGVFVREYPGHYFGCGGDVVSKHQLKLNQARNDVLVNECLIWRDVRKEMDKFVGKKLQRKASLTADERHHLAEKLTSGELNSRDAVAAKVFTDCSGRHYSWQQLCNMHGRYKYFTDADRYDRIADKLQQQKLAFVFASETLERFGCNTSEELVAKIQSRFRNWRIPFEHKEFSELGQSFRSGYDTANPKSYTAKERVVLALCDKIGCVIASNMSRRTGLSIKRRRYLIGISDAADGWTDGESYIAISRSFLQYRDFCDINQLFELGTLLLHEYCHTEEDQSTHTHSTEFYQTFHDCAESIGEFIQYGVGWVAEIYKRENTKLNKKLVKQMDKIEYLKRRSEKDGEAKLTETEMQLDAAARQSK